jgi:hypothetical protein
LKTVTVSKIWLQKIQINHKQLNFTIDFSDFRVVIDVYKY